METSEINARAIALLDRIEAFDRSCASREYTDTGVVWELFQEAIGFLAELTGHKGHKEIELDDLTPAEREVHDRTLVDNEDSGYLYYTHLYRLADGTAIAQDGDDAHNLTNPDD